MKPSTIPIKGSFIRIKDEYKQKYPEIKKYYTKEAWDYSCPVKVIEQRPLLESFLIRIKPTIFSNRTRVLFVEPNDERIEVVAMTERFEQGRFPKVGEFIRLTEEYKKKHKEERDAYSDYMWDHNGLTQVIKESGSHSSDTITLTTQPTIWSDEYSAGFGDDPEVTFVRDSDRFEILVQEPLDIINITLTLDDPIFCSCETPSLKENWAGGNKFFICTLCRKERKQ